MSRLYERLPALAHRNFRNYQLGNFVSNVGNRMQFFAILWHVYEKTHSNAYVGALGLLRVVPLVVFGLYGGVIADHFDRRKIVLITQCGLAAVAFGLFWITVGGHDNVWNLYAIVVAGAVMNAFNNPSRQAMIVNIVPPADFPNAASFNGIIWRLTDILGPALAGLLLGWTKAPYFSGLAWVYLSNAFSFLAFMAAVFSLPPMPPSADKREHTIRTALDSIRGGFRFFREAHVVRNTMIVDFWATFFAGSEALLPSYAHLLRLGPHGYGWLASATGIGAMIASASLAVMPTLSRQGLWVLRMVALFGISTILFGVSTNLPFAFLFLAGIGATDMVSTVLRQTIRQLSTPDHMRGRLGSIGMLFQTSGPQLGDSEAAYAANLFQTLGMAPLTAVRTSIVSGGVGGLLVGVWWMWRSHLVRYDRHVEPITDPGG